jgi:hypothetical protein
MRIEDTFSAPQRIITREAARGGDLAQWTDETGYHRAFIVRPATGDPLIRVDGSYEPVPSTATFVRLLAPEPPAVALTHAQWQLVLEALEDSADGWGLAAEDNRNLIHNDGSHAEQCSRDARDTLTAIKNQLK